MNLALVRIRFRFSCCRLLGINFISFIALSILGLAFRIGMDSRIIENISGFLGLYVDTNVSRLSILSFGVFERNVSCGIFFDSSELMDSQDE